MDISHCRQARREPKNSSHFSGRLPVSVGILYSFPYNKCFCGIHSHEVGKSSSESTLILALVSKVESFSSCEVPV